METSRPLCEGWTDSAPLEDECFHLFLRDEAVSDSASYLWAGVSGHQALQLQRGPLPDGEDPLSVALLLQGARLPGVEDADSRGRCRSSQQNQRRRKRLRGFAVARLDMRTRERFQRRRVKTATGRSLLAR